jgi:hypothetical protein
MCCFAQQVRDVSNTQIFARLSKPGSQYLVYKMNYVSDTPNAMILPLPVAQPAVEDAVRFIALDGYERFFDDLSLGFPALRSMRSLWDRALPVAAAPDSAAPQLKVHEIGSFIASFVPTLEDFDRLDPQFVIPRSSWEKIPYYLDYGFAVFQLKTLAGSVHPIALEFATRWSDRIFFPTVHIHDGEVHALEDFDHTLYLQNAAWDEVVGRYQGPQEVDPGTRFVRSQSAADRFASVERSEGILAPEMLIHRKQVFGRQPNSDIVVPATVAPHRSVGSLDSGSILAFTSGSVLAATLAWHYHRRMKISADAPPSAT